MQQALPSAPQIFFSQRCPLFNRKLSVGMRILYGSSCWCYVTNTLAIPLSMMVRSLAGNAMPAASQQLQLAAPCCPWLPGSPAAASDT
jgi:hypothetical protein